MHIALAFLLANLVCCVTPVAPDLLTKSADRSWKFVSLSVCMRVGHVGTEEVTYLFNANNIVFMAARLPQVREMVWT
jgi:hypothetical protein